MSVLYDKENPESLSAEIFVWILKKDCENIRYPLILPKVLDKTLKDNKFTHEINETFSQ